MLVAASHREAAMAFCKAAISPSLSCAGTGSDRNPCVSGWLGVRSLSSSASRAAPPPSEHRQPAVAAEQVPGCARRRLRQACAVAVAAAPAKTRHKLRRARRACGCCATSC
eukprot:10024499-Lingulodinium_polyedra.AAC.1